MIIMMLILAKAGSVKSCIYDYTKTQNITVTR